MVKIFSLVFFFIFSLHFAFGQKFEIFKGDTINKEDASGMKNGHWMIFNKTKKLPDYTDDQLVEEGDYVNNKKDGIWIQYYNSGKKKNEITYSGGKPTGYAKFYYKSGIVSEEGNWINGKWDGNYKYYYESGQIAYDWQFVNGKREGHQLYYYENGRVNYDGNWKNGQEDGELKEYNDKGQLVALKKYNGGKMDTIASKFYTPTASTPATAPVYKNEPKKEEPKADIKKSGAVETIIEEDTDRAWMGFKESGYHKVKTKYGVLIRDGYFDKGTFMNGKAYKYSGGKLIKTIIYKNGKPVEFIENK